MHVRYTGKTFAMICQLVLIKENPTINKTTHSIRFYEALDNPTQCNMCMLRSYDCPAVNARRECVAEDKI